MTQHARNYLALQQLLVIHAGIKISQVDLDSDIDELKLDSLALIRLIAEIERAYGKKYPIEAIFQKGNFRKIRDFVDVLYQVNV